MQILGKRSKMLLMGLLALMLITLGASFAVWDGQAALAATGNAAGYANAKVGDVIQFGRYWQKAMPTGYDDKDPIDWIVVDKDERTGQLTLMSKYILAYGSYFGNYYYNTDAAHTDSGTKALLSNISYNQAWCESNSRAFLNNLERWDLGGDKFDPVKGLDNDNRIPSVASEGQLKPSVGFSNALYNTGLSPATEGVQALIDNSATTGIFRFSMSQTYYQRPKVTDPAERLARNGFLDEAFSPDEKQMIVPKEIPGQISHRWPESMHTLDLAKYIQGTKDRVWLPSVEELNVKAISNNLYTNPSELASSVPFEYFKNWQKYTGQTNYNAVIQGTGTAFASAAGSLGNYSIPGWITDVSKNWINAYWTRSAMSFYCYAVCSITSLGTFNYDPSNASNLGVRPCIILKY